MGDHRETYRLKSLNEAGGWWGGDYEDMKRLLDNMSTANLRGAADAYKGAKWLLDDSAREMQIIGWKLRQAWEGEAATRMHEQLGKLWQSCYNLRQAASMAGQNLFENQAQTIEYAKEETQQCYTSQGAQLFMNIGGGTDGGASLGDATLENNKYAPEEVSVTLPKPGKGAYKGGRTPDVGTGLPGGGGTPGGGGGGGGIPGGGGTPPPVPHPHPEPSPDPVPPPRPDPVPRTPVPYPDPSPPPNPSPDPVPPPRPDPIPRAPVPYPNPHPHPDPVPPPVPDPAPPPDDGSALAGLPGGGGVPGGLGGGGGLPGGIPGGGAGGVPGGGFSGGTPSGQAAVQGPENAAMTRGVAGRNGAGGMPMGAPMGRGGGQGQQQENERTTWLTEDEDVWGGDGDAAPPVIG